jgi:hypothetical protein
MDKFFEEGKKEFKKIEQFDNNNNILNSNSIEAALVMCGLSIRVFYYLRAGKRGKTENIEGNFINVGLK